MTSPIPAERIKDKGKLAKEINETIRYTMWSVFPPRSGAGRFSPRG
ncbi:hypothetical protein [Aeromicrobium sp. UC242_57]